MSNFGSTTMHWVVFAATIVLVVAVMGGNWLNRRGLRNRTIYGVSTVVDAVLAHVAKNVRVDGSNIDSLMTEQMRLHVNFQLPVYRMLARTVVDHLRAGSEIDGNVHMAFLRALDAYDRAEQPVTV